jgi:hypothetical protein
MIKVYINKQKDRYDCEVYEDGKYTKKGSCFYSLKAAEEFKKKMETIGSFNGNADKPKPAAELPVAELPVEPVSEPTEKTADTLPDFEADGSGQLSFAS